MRVKNKNLKKSTLNPGANKPLSILDNEVLALPIDNKVTEINTLFDTPRYLTYTIKSGDTLSSIARKFTGSAKNYKDLAEILNIEDVNNIKAGDTIEIPLEYIKKSNPDIYAKIQEDSKSYVDDINTKNSIIQKREIQPIKINNEAPLKLVDISHITNKSLLPYISLESPYEGILGELTDIGKAVEYIENEKALIDIARQKHRARVHPGLYEKMYKRGFEEAPTSVKLEYLGSPTPWKYE